MTFFSLRKSKRIPRRKIEKGFNFDWFLYLVEQQQLPTSNQIFALSNTIKPNLKIDDVVIGCLLLVFAHNFFVFYQTNNNQTTNYFQNYEIRLRRRIVQNLYQLYYNKKGKDRLLL